VTALPGRRPTSGATPAALIGVEGTMESSAIESGQVGEHGGTNGLGLAYCGAILAASAVAFVLPVPVGARGPVLAGVPFEFLLFGMTLLGVALFHRITLQVALAGMVSIATFKVAFTTVSAVDGTITSFDVVHHLHHEWVVLANLLCLLLGFTLLSNHFEQSKIPELLPKWLPNGWMGGFVLLCLVFVLSSFLDNIAAAMIGATIAKIVFKGRVHIGFLAAIVGASNAGGSGSVVGDTTTTMMWIAGVSPLAVLRAYAAAFPALLVCGVIAARQQDAYQRIQADETPGLRIDWGRVLIVATVLVFAIAVNVVVNVQYAEVSDAFPFIGAAIALSLVVTAPIRRPSWGLLPAAFKGSCFLLSLVVCASLMPVKELPSPWWGSAMGLGFLSAVFDNIPLTALAITQGGYDWGMLAYTVGFGGSMIWFGSSAGVAVSNGFPEAKSTANWLRHGWHVTLAYVVGFAIMLGTVGWHPTPKRGDAPPSEGQSAVEQPGQGAR